MIKHSFFTFTIVSIFCLSVAVVSAQEPESGLKNGYVLVAPMGSGAVHLIDSDKKIVHSWDCEDAPGNSTYLEKSGTLLRTAKVQDNELFQARGGGGGIVRRYSWDGELLWDYRISDETFHHHHDIEPMPNGNVLAIAWERHTREESIAAGRDPETISGDAIWTETILELKPVGKNDAEVVWKWRLWDHLVQEHDESKAKYGKVADNLGLANFNYGVRRGGSDWIHMNAIDYNADRDEIALSARWFNEGWIIDHSTTTEEAATDAGGKHGKGGNILYRWGNPAAYQAGDSSQRQFFLHHDVRWIEDDCPGAGNFLLFNNGDREASRNFSSVDEFKPPLNSDGSYITPEQGPYAPEEFTWSYSDPGTFHSGKISGAQRLPNGNTFVCCGEQGWLFEVTPEGQRIWEMKVSDLLQPSQPGSSSKGPPQGKGEPKGKGKGGPKGKGGKGGKGKGGKGKGGGGGGARGSAFRAPWYADDYSPKFETLK